MCYTRQKQSSKSNPLKLEKTKCKKKEKEIDSGDIEKTGNSCKLGNVLRALTSG